MTTKPDFCAQCPITNLTTGYSPLQRGYGRELIVGEASGEEEAEHGKCFIGGAGQWLNSLLRAAKLSRGSFSIINTLGCRPADNTYPTEDSWPEAAFEFLVAKLATEAGVSLKKHPERRGEFEAQARDLGGRGLTREAGREAISYCANHHLWPSIQICNPTRIIALGDKALQAVTPRAGILTWRGSPLPLKGAIADGPRVIPTLHPAYLMRSANMFSVAVGDLRKTLNIPPENYNLYATPTDLEAFVGKPEISFDLEWDSYNNITLFGCTDSVYHGAVADWTPEVQQVAKRIIESAGLLVGQNIIGADTRWFDKLGWTIPYSNIIDTMLIQHLVQPDMRHSLGFIASVFTNKVFWKGQGEESEDEDGVSHATGAQWRTWDHPDAIPRNHGGYGGCTSSAEAYRLYNARDFDAALQASFPLRTLLTKYGMERTYKLISIPLAYLCRDIADRGLRLDNSRVGLIRDTLQSSINELELQLPAGLAPYEKPVTRQIPAPPNTYKPKLLTCKGHKKTNSLHEKVSYLATAPGLASCPTCGISKDVRLSLLKRIKVQALDRIVPWNSSDQVMAYAAAKALPTHHHMKSGKPTADKSARKKWSRHATEFTIVDRLKKLSTQRNSFAKPGLLTTPRMYFNLLVHGTSEGRLSSSGRRKGIDSNIQNQPKAVRKIFVPDHPGWGFLNADIVQGENMMTTWLAQDWERWERLQTPGYDEHSDMAAAFFNKPYSEVCKGGPLQELRAPGKIINHGKNYGLGVDKCREYMSLEGFTYTRSDVEEMFAIWASKNKRTAQWQRETIEIAQKQGYLRNAFGRMRWFQGRDFATKALAFLPASTLADAMHRMMIGLHEERFHPEIQELKLTRSSNLPAPWAIYIQVHDSFVCQGPDELHKEAAHRLAWVMTQPWVELDNFAFKIDLEYSTVSWGDVTRITI